MTTHTDTEALDLDALETWSPIECHSSPTGASRTIKALIAELRQERERADEAESLADVRRQTISTYETENASWELRSHVAERERDRLKAALSRAEGAIARIDGEVKNFEKSDNDVVCEIGQLLIDYNKQKEGEKK